MPQITRGGSDFNNPENQPTGTSGAVYVHEEPEPDYITNFYTNTATAAEPDKSVIDLTSALSDLLALGDCKIGDVIVNFRTEERLAIFKAPAGAKGDAILFVARREKRLLSAIERATKKPIELMDLPSTEVINDKRIASFKQRISDTIAQEDGEEFEFYSQLIEQYQQEHNVPATEIAAALAKLLQGDTPLLLKNQPARPSSRREKFEREPRQSRKRSPERKSPERSERAERPKRERKQQDKPDPIALPLWELISK